MPNLTFVYRNDSDNNRVLQGLRELDRWLYDGSVQLDTGFATTSSDDGVVRHTYSYRALRPLAFQDPQVGFRTSMINPGDYGLVRRQFLLGRVSPAPVQTTTLLTSPSVSHQFVSGRATALGVDTLGSLTDFAIYPSTVEDPKQFYVETATDLDSGGVTQAWTRNYAVFVPHRNTRYLGIGSRSLSVPNTGGARKQYFRKWMVEKAHVGGSFPSAYGRAREVVVRVKPDRLNLFPNPSFEVDTSSIAAVSNASFTRSTAVHTDIGVAALAVTVTSAGNGSIRSATNAIPVKSLKHYSLSAAILPATTARNVEFWVEYYSSALTLVGTTAVVTAQEIDATHWAQVQLPNTVAPSGSSYASVVMRVLGAGAGEVHYLDTVLFERSEECLPYFDGSSNGDTVWEQPGNLALVGKSRSYLYKNRAERYAAILRVLQENVPMGVGIKAPQFGVLPTDW